MINKNNECIQVRDFVDVIVIAVKKCVLYFERPIPDSVMFPYISQSTYFETRRRNANVLCFYCESSLPLRDQMFIGKCAPLVSVKTILLIV